MVEKMFSGAEVFEMTWAVLAALRSGVSCEIGGERLPASYVADVVRTLLEQGASPIGLIAAEAPRPPATGATVTNWYWTARSRAVP